MRPTIWLPAAAALLAGAAQAQQDQRPRPPRAEIERDIVIERDGNRTFTFRGMRQDSTRAWLGVATGSSGRRDTLGLLIEDVVAGSPAAKAGLQEGERLTSINGTSLRLPAADADDPGMGGVVQRRLTRVLAALAPGDEVELGVHGDGRSRTVKVKTIAASDAPQGRTMAVRPLRRESRAVLGVTLGGDATRRDSAGIFVSAVASDGPAEKAGIIEGDRLAAINGQDLRVAREDAGDPAAARAKASKLQRVLSDVKPGDDVELRVVSAGRSRTVRVKTVASSDLAEQGMTLSPMGGMELEMLRVPRPPRAPRPPMPPDAPGEMLWFEGGPEQDVRVRINGEEVDVRRFMQERVPGLLRQFRFDRELPGRVEVRQGRRITI